MSNMSIKTCFITNTNILLENEFEINTDIEQAVPDILTTHIYVPKLITIVLIVAHYSYIPNSTLVSTS